MDNNDLIIETPVSDKITQLSQSGPSHYTRAVQYAAATVPQLNNIYERMKKDYVMMFDIASAGHEMEMLYAKKNYSGYTEYPRSKDITDRSKKQPAK